MPIKRRKTTQVMVGQVGIGSDFPVVIQSMTNTPTSAVDLTVAQITELVDAGSELVRVTINNHKAATAIPLICQKLHAKGIHIPLIGDFHFNGHQLLTDFPEMASALSKYRINPGNLGRGEKQDAHYKTIIETAIKYDKPVRIGVNSGSLDQELLDDLINKNALSNKPQSSAQIFSQAMIISALQSAQQAIAIGLPKDHIILSAKTSDVQDLISIYDRLANECDFPLHLGLTEAGLQEQGIVSSTAAIAILLERGIGDTIRVSLTPDQQTSRSKEVVISRHILQSLGIRHFFPKIICCPGCGRTSSKHFHHLAETVQKYVNKHFDTWIITYPDVAHLTIAVMGCIVNGPGESRHADIGISLPGDAEEPAAPVYIQGKHFKTLRGEHIDQDFLKILEDFIIENQQSIKGERHG